MSTEDWTGPYLQKCRNSLADKSQLVVTYNSEEELESVVDALEDEGYRFEDGKGERSPDLSENPGIELPYFGDLKLPSNLSEGLGKMIDTVSPAHCSIYRTEIIKENDKLYATTNQDYETLQTATEEVLEP